MKLISGPIVGAVTHKDAKIWIFWSHTSADEQSPVCHIFADKQATEEKSRVAFTEISDSEHISGGIRGVFALAKVSFQPGAKNVFFKILTQSGADVGARIFSFIPFPKAGSAVDSFSFGLVSCHRTYVAARRNQNYVAPMWKSLAEKMRAHDCRFLLQAGDQVYADQYPINAWKWSLKGGNQQKILWNYRQVYLNGWAHQEAQDVLQSFPQFMIWDDHEISNGWGSDVSHTTDPRQKDIFKAARQAYVEFQNSHNPDPLKSGELYYGFSYGPAAFLVMDLRGHRNYAAYLENPGNDVFPLAGKEQWDAITEWMNSDLVQRSKILFVVTSVPVIHLSRKFRDLGRFKNDIRDQWSTDHNKNERRKLFKLLFDWSGEPNRPVFILGGDVHVGTVAMLKDENDKKMYQITSSPITNLPAAFLDKFLTLYSSEFEFHLERGDAQPVRSVITHRYHRRNFGIIDVRFEDQKVKVTLNMYQQHQANPDVVQFPVHEA
ncbi:alkaline phosphatase family protein [candidate division KSB1 bacterium]|nr:alkaline phosphatase family protein [candidate division KSB1 bacterium]